MTDAQQLLAEYARNGSEAAFRKVVERYVNLVYSTALRLVGGDAHRAEDVAQIVFTDLARKAHTLSDKVMLGGWLYQHTFHVATKAVRAERRRQTRESEAVRMNSLQENSENHWRQVAPVLDEAITQLGDEDRTAILLRFFEQRDFRAIGTALGSNEDAARMRVNRALEKLEVMLKRRGVVLPAAALGMVLAGEAVTAAPAGLATSVAAAAIATPAATLATVSTIGKALAMTKIQTGIISALVVAGVAAPVAVYHHAQTKLRANELALRQQADQLAALTSENQRLSNQIAQTKDAQALSKSQLEDLLRLRNEVGALKKQLAEVPKVAPKNVQQVASAAAPSEAAQKYQEALDQQMVYVKMNSAKQWMLAFMMYANDHQGQMPPAFEHATNYVGDDRSILLATNVFEIVNQTPLNAIANPASTIVLREIEAAAAGDGWVKTYGFADGHVEVHKFADNNYQDWESRHGIAAQGQ